MLQTSMHRLNFFKFNALQFNIYYVGMIAFCFLTCLGMGTHYTFSHVINPHHQLENNVSVVSPNSQNNENLTKRKGEISNPGNINLMPNAGSGGGNAMSNVPKTLNYNKPAENHNAVKSNTLKADDLNSDPKPAMLSNPSIKTDSSHKNVEHKPVVIEADSSKIKKRTFYITKQDTIYKYDTLRAPKPKKRRF